MRKEAGIGAGASIACAVLLLLGLPAQGASVSRGAETSPADSLGPSGLTLEDALLRSLEVAPRIRQWGAGREAAEAGAAWLGSAYLPTLSAGASVSRSRFPTTVTPIREPGVFPPLSDEVREASVSARWTLFDFGAGREGRSAARTLAEAAGAREAQARMETLETVADHFLQLAVLEALEEAQRARLDGLRESDAQLRLLVEEGRLPAVDRLRVAELLLEAEADLRSTEEETRRVAASLSTELMLDRFVAPGEIAVPRLPEGAGAAGGAAGGSVEVGGLPHERREPPPDLRGPSPELRAPLLNAAEARVRAAEHEAREAYTALLPRLEVVGRQAFRTGPDLPTDRDWSIGLQVSVPLFRGEALTAVRVREARVRERTAELEGARASLETALRDLRALEAEARERMGVLDARTAHLEEAYRIEEASYREGRTTLADLLSTEARLAGARAERIGLTGRVLLARLRTAALTGELTVPLALNLLGEDR
jgi:outer membrane protein